MDKNMINAKLYSPLVLAYIGDAVYEVYVRERILLSHHDMPAYKLHKLAVKYVKAGAQANSVHSIMEMLSEEEVSVYKRGRNAKSPTVPKNADVGEYRCATGFEALLGYLHLSGNIDRLNEVMKAAFDAVEM